LNFKLVVRSRSKSENGDPKTTAGMFAVSILEEALNQRPCSYRNADCGTCVVFFEDRVKVELKVC
jgi:hypothetical protein